jgi:hypothetical protein
MKKLFTILAFCPLFAFSQNAKFSPSNVYRANRDVSFPNPSPVKYSSGKVAGQNQYPTTTLGTTNYDLQSNSAIARRIIQLSGNRMSVVWTTSASSSPFADRGSAYNHFNGTNWVNNSSYNTRIENGTRTGWPNINSITQGGKDIEVILAHAVTAAGFAGGFVMSKNDAVGSSTWTSNSVLNDTYKSTEPGPIWGRTAVNGGKIFLISCFTAPSAAQTDTPIIAGIRRPNVYSIYDIASDTWTTKNQLLPEYDSTRYNFGNSDAYSIDANGNTVAILIGGLGEDLALWKSTNGGSSWTKTLIVDAHDTISWHPRSDPLPYNNGSVHVFVDKAGVTHAFFPLLNFAFDSIIGGDTSRFNPTRPADSYNGIAHWSDRINPQTGNYYPFQFIGGMEDADNDGTLLVADSARSRVWGGYGDAWSSGGQSFAAITTMPMASEDADGKLYLTYTSLVESDENANDAENYRDIYVTWSADTGLTWAKQQNMTRSVGLDDVFQSTARLVDSKLRLIYLEKEDPGSAVSTDASGNNVQQDNMPIRYFEVDKSSILAGTVGINNAAPIAYDFKVLQNQPNPFTDETSVGLTLNKSGRVSMTLSNVIGKQIMNKNYGMMQAGNHFLNVSGSNLSSGVYFYTVTVSGVSQTRRMIVE